MKIIEKTYSWSGNLAARPKTNYILLHHMAGNGSADNVHSAHLKNGWAGIGYHFYVRKDGTVYRGRPMDKTGSHVSGYNSQCLGVCFEGNFEKEKISVQGKAVLTLRVYEIFALAAAVLRLGLGIYKTLNMNKKVIQSP